MKIRQPFSLEHYPLLLFQKILEINGAFIRAKTSGQYVIRGFFDTYRQNAVAPDHCLKGNIENVMAAMFYSLFPYKVKTFSLQVSAALSSKNLQYQTNPYDVKKGTVHFQYICSVRHFLS